MPVQTLLGTVTLSLGFLISTASADVLYRCSDGTFTNKVERQCPPYESKGIVRVQGTDEKFKSPSADIKFADDRVVDKSTKR